MIPLYVTKKVAKIRSNELSDLEKAAVAGYVNTINEAMQGLNRVLGIKTDSKVK